MTIIQKRWCWKEGQGRSTHEEIKRDGTVLSSTFHGIVHHTNHTEKGTSSKMCYVCCQTTSKCMPRYRSKQWRYERYAIGINIHAGCAK